MTPDHWFGHFLCPQTLLTDACPSLLNRAIRSRGSSPVCQWRSLRGRNFVTDLVGIVLQSVACARVMNKHSNQCDQIGRFFTIWATIAFHQCLLSFGQNYAASSSYCSGLNRLPILATFCRLCKHWLTFYSKHLVTLKSAANGGSEFGVCASHDSAILDWKSRPLFKGTNL